MLEQASILESPDTVEFREEKKQYFAFTVFFLILQIHGRQITR